jgi:hypothetical protein
MKIESEYNGIKHGELCWVWDSSEEHAIEAYFMGYRRGGAKYPIVVGLICGGESSYHNAKKIEPKRELKATDLIGWWATNGMIVSPINVWISANKIALTGNAYHSLDQIKDWRFSKDPFIPLALWQTLDEVREGLS